MKILHIVTGLQKASGVTTFVENVVAELRMLGHEVDVVTREGLVESRSRTMVGGGVSSAPLSGGQGTGRSTYFHVSTLKSYDLVHIHGLWDLWLHRWAKVARKAGVKVVWSPHGMLTPWALKYKWWKKFAALALYQWNDLRHADALHVTAASEVADVRRLGLKNKIIVAPLGVTLPELGVRTSGGGVCSPICESRPAQEGSRESHQGVGVACE